MKPKLIPCLALVLSCVLWVGCHPSVDSGTVRQPAYGRWARQLKSSWTPAKIVLYRNSGEVVLLDAREAVYFVWSKTNSAGGRKGFDFPMMAFIDPATRNVWIGGVDTNPSDPADGVYTNYFMETDSKILRAGNNLVDGVFDCQESPIQKAQPAETLDSVIGRYEKLDDDTLPFSPGNWLVRLADRFPGKISATRQRRLNGSTWPVDIWSWIFTAKATKSPATPGWIYEP
jgi:hypothetical protein